MKRLGSGAVLLLASLFVASPASAATTVWRLGTEAPDGSIWHAQLKSLAAKVSQASGGAVQLQLFVGGAKGDDANIVRNLRTGALQAGSLGSPGAGLLASDVLAVDLPMLYENVDERDFVLAQRRPALDGALLDKGFVALSWSDLGSVRFFSTTSRPTLPEMRKSKLLSGDDQSTAVWSALGFAPVRVSSVELVPSLQTGVIDAAATLPLVAFAARLHDKAKSMADLAWASRTVTLVVSKSAWESVPADLRPRLTDVFREHGPLLTKGARVAETDSIAQMKAQGLTVVAVTDKVEWQKAATAARDAIRGKVIDGSAIDAVTRLVAERRAKR